MANAVIQYTQLSLSAAVTFDVVPSEQLLNAKKTTKKKQWKINLARAINHTITQTSPRKTLHSCSSEPTHTHTHRERERNRERTRFGVMAEL